jgi:hypothetical protein
MKKVGFIDYFLDEWHANNYPKWLKEASNNEYQVVYCWGEIDSPRPGGMTNKDWAKNQGVELCATMEEVIQKSNVLCVLAPDNPETHERLTKLPLMSGKPTFIDKTFANDKATALRIFEIADKYGTPCITSSALRFADEYLNAKKEGIDSIISMSSGVFEIYCIHQIEPIVELLGCDAKRVKFIGTDNLPICIIEFDSGASSTFYCFKSGCPFQTYVNYDGGNCEVLNINSDFFKNEMLEIVKFYETSEIIVPHNQTIAIMAIREACIKSLSCKNQWIKV